jgi:pyridoxal phosphate enzyme (YggS family)
LEVEPLKIAQAIATVKQQIADAAYQFSRSPESIQLLAVSKTHPITTIMTAYQSGQHGFGENYLQEAVPKIQALRDYKLEWHFIGQLQSNKTRLVAENFAWVQSLETFNQAQRLNDQRPEQLPPLNVCIQINISQEQQKSGISLDDLPKLARRVMKLPRLRLRGLMALPAFSPDFELQRIPFRTLSTAYQQLQTELSLELDTLSMGMSSDMVAAIAEGATLVRVGTAIFGERVKPGAS